MKPELKFIPFGDAVGNKSKPWNRVAYTVIGTDSNAIVVFTGLHDITDGRGKRTDDAGAEIVLAIVANETETLCGAKYKSCTFYDLQTGAGYGSKTFIPGKFNFKKLELKWSGECMRPESVSHAAADCDPGIIRLFDEFVNYASVPVQASPSPIPASYLHRLPYGRTAIPSKAHFFDALA